MELVETNETKCLSIDRDGCVDKVWENEVGFRHGTNSRQKVCVASMIAASWFLSIMGRVVKL